jgi:phosphatidylglycerophosphatase A
VVKPPPVYQLQSLPGGAGVMADDLAAAAYGVALLLLARAAIPGF